MQELEAKSLEESAPTDPPAGVREKLSNFLAMPFHALAACWIGGILLLARYAPGQYTSLMQEDRPIEWATVWLFGAAGVLQLRRAIRNRFFFDALVGLFCLFVAGEEFSWGQRLFGYGSPEYFLAHNFQQELNLHNLPGSFIKPRWFLIAALTGYGLFLPLVARFDRVRDLMNRLGVVPPPAQLAPWFVISVFLLVWYPLSLTAEWVESLAGALFVASVASAAGTQWIVISLALIFGVTMSKATNIIEHSRDADRSACAQLEIQALLSDITLGDSGTQKIKTRRSLHKRLWTAAVEGFVNRENAEEFAAVQCASGPDKETLERRRRYLVDPWGMSYWIAVRSVDDRQQRILIYSFGPNRRRDGTPNANSGDDIMVTGYLRHEPETKLPDLDLDIER